MSCSGPGGPAALFCGADLGSVLCLSEARLPSEQTVVRCEIDLAEQTSSVDLKRMQGVKHRVEHVERSRWLRACPFPRPGPFRSGDQVLLGAQGRVQSPWPQGFPRALILTLTTSLSLPVCSVSPLSGHTSNKMLSAAYLEFKRNGAPCIFLCYTWHAYSQWSCTCIFHLRILGGALLLGARRPRTVQGAGPGRTPSAARNTPSAQALWCTSASHFLAPFGAFPRTPTFQLH